VDILVEITKVGNLKFIESEIKAEPKEFFSLDEKLYLFSRSRLN